MNKLYLVSLIALSITGFAAYNMWPQEESDYVTRMQKQADHINSLGTSWVAGVNHRFEKTPMTTYLMHEKYLRGPKLPQKLFSAEESSTPLPESFDPETYAPWSQCFTLREVRDQSSCGSCWAFGATEAMSDRICVASIQRGDNPPLDVDLSAVDLMSCCVGGWWPSEWGTDCGDGCNGGYLSQSWNYWVSHGIATGGLYGDTNTCKPYPFAPCAHHTESTRYPACPSAEYVTPSCSSTCDVTYKGTTSYEDSKSYGESAYTVSGEENIMRELMNHGPCEAAFSVYSDFENYKSGVYENKSGSFLGGHAIKMVGWGVDENGVKYWKIANSWNETWGEKGYFRIRRGTDECGMEDQVTCGLPKLK